MYVLEISEKCLRNKFIEEIFWEDISLTYERLDHKYEFAALKTKFDEQVANEERNNSENF